MSLARVLWIAFALGLGLVLGARAAAAPAPAEAAFGGAFDAGHQELQRPTGCVATPRGFRRDMAMSQAELPGRPWQPAPGGDDTPGVAPPASHSLPHQAVAEAHAPPASDARVHSAGTRSAGCRGPPERA